MKNILEKIYESKSKSYILIDTTAKNYNDDDWDFFWEDIDNLDKEYQSFLATGDLGLWDGKKEIYPEYATDLRKLIEKCINDMDDIIVSIKNGKIEIESRHHDGRNYFTISALSEYGDEKWDEYDYGDGNLDFLKEKKSFLEIK